MTKVGGPALQNPERAYGENWKAGGGYQKLVCKFLGVLWTKIKVRRAQNILIKKGHHQNLTQVFLRGRWTRIVFVFLPKLCLRNLGQFYPYIDVSQDILEDVFLIEIRAKQIDSIHTCSYYCTLLHVSLLLVSTRNLDDVWLVGWLIDWWIDWFICSLIHWICFDWIRFEFCFDLIWPDLIGWLDLMVLIKWKVKLKNMLHERKEKRMTKDGMKWNDMTWHDMTWHEWMNEWMHEWKNTWIYHLVW